MPSLSSYQEADQAARDHALALEDDLAAKLRPLISKLVGRALRNLRAKTRSITASGAQWTPPDADELMNRHALEQEVNAALASFHSKTVKRVVDGIATELGLSFDVKNPLMVGVLAGQGQKITHISASLRRDVMAQIEDAWERGLSIGDTVALVTEHTAEFAASRAATIARTEIIGTANQASLAAARISGAAPYKQWLATNDSLTRESHAEADGQTVPIDEPFLVDGVPMDAPGDPSAPAGLVINCRCTVIYSDSPLQASGGRMADTAPTLTPMVVSIEGIDYTLPQPITEMGLRTLNPEITDDHLGVLLALTAAAPPDAPPVAPVASIGEWTADPLVPFGVATRDGRMIRAGSLAMPAQLPVPLMAMLEDVHGQSMTLPASMLVGAITSFDANPQRLSASGTFDDTEDGRAAMSAVEDGRMGISADLAVTEYEYVVSQDAVDAAQAEMDGEAPVEDPADPPASDDVPGGVVVDSGDQADMGMFVVTAGEVMGATIVPFAAFDSARIELTSLAADGHPTHARVVMPLRISALLTAPTNGDEGDTLDDASRGVRAPLTPSVSNAFDVLPAIDAIIAGQRAASGIAPLEALAAALRSERGEAPRPVIDADVALSLVNAIGNASRDPGLVDLAAALAASSARPADAPAPIIVNPPPVTVHTPDVKVENHPADVTVNAAGKPRGLRIIRDAAGNAESYEPIEDEQ